MEGVWLQKVQPDSSFRGAPWRAPTAIPRTFSAMAPTRRHTAAMEASSDTTAAESAAAHAAAPRHADGAASKPPRARKSTTASRKSQTTHARRPAESTGSTNGRGEGPRHQVTARVRNSRGSASQSLAKRNANWPTLPSKGSREEGMVR